MRPIMFKFNHLFDQLANVPSTFSATLAKTSSSEEVATIHPIWRLFLWIASIYDHLLFSLSGGRIVFPLIDDRSPFGAWYVNEPDSRYAFTWMDAVALAVALFALAMVVATLIWCYLHYPRRVIHTYIIPNVACRNPSVELDLSVRTYSDDTWRARFLATYVSPIANLSHFEWHDCHFLDHNDNAVFDAPDGESALSITRVESEFNVPHFRYITHSATHTEVIKITRVSPFINAGTYVDVRPARYRNAPAVSTRLRVCYMLVEHIHLTSANHSLYKVLRSAPHFIGMAKVVSSAQVIFVCPEMGHDNLPGSGIMAIGDLNLALARRIGLYNLPAAYLSTLLNGTAVYLQSRYMLN